LPPLQCKCQKLPTQLSGIDNSWKWLNHQKMISSLSTVPPTYTASQTMVHFQQDAITLLQNSIETLILLNSSTIS